MGIPMAHGAAPADAQGLVLTETTQLVQLVPIGIGCGLAAALLLTQASLRTCSMVSDPQTN